MTRDEIGAEVEATERKLKRLREKLEEPEARPVTEGWSIEDRGGYIHINRTTPSGGLLHVFMIDSRGAYPVLAAGGALDGIATDGSRIKVYK